MAKSGRYQIGGQPRELSRRRFLHNAGIGAASVPFLGAFVEALGGANAAAQGQPSRPPASSKDPWPERPAYRFAMVCHQTADPFFVPLRTGANDACALLGATYTWDGSATGMTAEMVAAFDDAIDNQVDGIACCVVDPKAFNAVTDQALAAGIPVVAFNAEAATSGNHAMSYIGQDFYAAGAALAERMLPHLQKGDLVGGMIGAPASVTEQGRMNGAASVFRTAGVDLAQVVIGTIDRPAATRIAAWYKEHQGVKFMFATAGSNGAAVASVIQKLALAKRGTGGAAFDVSSPVLQEVSKGNLVFTLDQQAYLQGFLPIFELFVYNVTGGLIIPVDVDTGHKYVTKENVGDYLSRRDSWEGSSTVPVVFTPPRKITVR
jgi:simple sugar transport system substrate-binding protein